MIQAIQIQPKSRVPKYKQLVSTLSRRIKNRSFKEDQLPSINRLSAVLDISRDTVEKAYRELRAKNLIESVPGKGYFIKNQERKHDQKILLLFNKLSAHKKIVYESFIAAMGPQANIDFHIYHNDLNLFERLLSSHLDQYSHYVIVPHFYAPDHRVQDLINLIPKHKLVLLDKRLAGITGRYACVYQDFEQNIYDALREAHVHLQKYERLKLVFPGKAYQPREIINGFQRFCIDYNFKGKLVPNIEQEPLAAGDVFITMMETDLVCLVKKIRDSSWQVGTDVGILSYNENPLKEVLLDGISVMSTDFQLLGKTVAEMILDNRKEVVENPFRLILRGSL